MRRAYAPRHIGRRKQEAKLTHTVLSGHVSPETAYVVDDYPYGFRLRCKIRYWLEYKTNKGFRFVSQTSNPKRPGLVWNAPKASKYSKCGAAMILDDDTGHVEWRGLGEYVTGKEAAEWSEKYRDGVPADGLRVHDAWVRAKVAYDSAQAAIKKDENDIPPLSVGLTEDRKAFADVATNRPGDEAAKYAEETGVSYSAAFTPAT